MKNQFVIAALTIGAIALGTNNAHAQDRSDATTDASISLKEVISIVSKDNKSVAFEYHTANDYNSDKTISDATTLTVTSSNVFNIKVNAKGANFASGTNVIPVDVLTIDAKSGGTVAGSVNLTQGVKTLVEKSPGGSELTWNLDYTIPKGKSIEHILGKKEGNYTQTIMYTVTN